MPKPSLSPSLPAQPARLRVPLSKPLRHPRYRRLWLANIVSNLGTWTQTFASAWLIASMSESASITTLVQTATYIPIFLFALFAGVIADAVDRPKFLFFCNLYMALCACAMAAMVISGHASAAPVLALTFALASGTAFVWPAWQASVAGLVEADELEAAATLNNLSYSVASIVGPALGGILFNWIGAGALFLVNAVSFVGLLAVYWAWWQERLPHTAVRHGFTSSMKTGLSTAFGCGRYRRILINVCTVFFASIAFAALLPLFVRDVLHLDSSTFGTLMGSLGAGAVLAAFLLPSLRVRFDKTTLLSGALLVFGLMLMLMPLTTSLWVLVPLIVCGGMAWSAIVSTMNAAAQSSFPQNLRARTLSIYLFVMAAGYTLGSLVWGRVADSVGVRVAFAVAGLCMVVNAVALATRKHDNPI